MKQANNQHQIHVRLRRFDKPHLSVAVPSDEIRANGARLVMIEMVFMLI